MTASATLAGLCHSRWLMARNSFRHPTREFVAKTAILAALAVFFVWADYWFFHRLLTQVMAKEALGALRITLLARLLTMVFVAFFSMLLFSNIVSALSTIYLSRDLDLLLSSPIPVIGIFLSKLSETLFQTSWMLFIFGVPIFVAYGQVYGASWAYYLLQLPVLVTFMIIPASVGAAFTTLLLRYFPARRTHRVLTVLGVLFIAALVILFRSLRPEQLVQPIGPELLLAYLEGARIPSSPWLPSTWASDALIALLERHNAGYLLELGKLTGAALLTTAAACGLAGRLYLTSRSGQEETAVDTIARRSSGRLERILGCVTDTPTAALLTKEIKVFARDTSQWSQLFMLGALVFIYVFNIWQLPVKAFGIQNFVSYLNLALAGFVLAAVAARFAFPAVSMEGGVYWVIRSAPVNYQRYLWSKFVLYAIPLVVLGETITVLTNLILEVGTYMMVLSLIATLLMSVALTGLGIGLGAIFPRFKAGNAAQVAVGAGGVLFMIVSLSYVGALTFLEAWPTFTRLLHLGMVSELKIALSHAAVVGLSLAVIVVPMMLGVRALGRGELQ